MITCAQTTAPPLLYQVVPNDSAGSHTLLVSFRSVLTGLEDEDQPQLHPFILILPFNPEFVV